MAKKKVDLAAEAKKIIAETKVEGEVTEEILFELCPAPFLAAFKKAKTQAQRADLLYKAEEYRKEAAREVKAMEDFNTKLKRWFIQCLPEGAATGITGKLGRVQINAKTSPSVMNWDKFYDYIRKNKAFELLNRAPNAKAISERWEDGKVIPGVEKFHYKSVSVTKK